MSFDSAQLKASYFDDNLARARLSADDRGLVEAAASVASVVELDDGTPVLMHGSHVLGADFDPESLLDVTQRAGNPVTFVVFGIGMGHTVRGLRAFSSAPLVVFEPDPGLLRSFFENGPSDLSDVPIVCSLHDLTQIWPRLSNGKQSVTVVNTPGYRELFPEQAQSVRETVGELVQRSGVNDATHRLRARVWIQDVFANLELLREHPTFLALAGQYQGVPAFIVGAGPSLGKNGRLLADAAKKGIVFALNSSARALDSYGVEPQVLACMESIDVSHLFEGVSYIDRVARAISLTAHPQNLRTGGGPALAHLRGHPAAGSAAHEPARVSGPIGVRQRLHGGLFARASAWAARQSCSSAKTWLTPTAKPTPRARRTKTRAFAWAQTGKAWSTTGAKP